MCVRCVNCNVDGCHSIARTSKASQVSVSGRANLIDRSSILYSSKTGSDDKCKTNALEGFDSEIRKSE